MSSHQCVTLQALKLPVCSQSQTHRIFPPDRPFSTRANQITRNANFCISGNFKSGRGI